METTLLATKLYIPPPCLNLVPRPRLIAALSKSLTCSLTLISAPAGYGKTTLVSSWLREAGASAAWLSLDEGDNDPTRFLQHLLTALHKIAPRPRPVPPGVPGGTQTVSLEALLLVLIDEFSAFASEVILVLDDFHVISAEPILEMLATLLERLPPQVHLVLLSRSDPPIPLSRLRARNQLLEIRAGQLRFTMGETAQFLNDLCGLSLSSGDVRAMGERTEGWAAGLRLATIAMQSRLASQGDRGLHRFVTEFAGSHHYIVDYLSDEVLRLQPERVRAFLLRTSILDRMCGSLCSAVVAGTAEPVDGQAMLESLEQMNLFLVPLDDERRWYRYHHLFSDVLRRNLAHLFPEQISCLHCRASQWYEQNGSIPEAAHHALMAGDRDRAASLVEEYGCPLLMRGEFITLLKMVEAIGTQAIARPWLSIYWAWAIAMSGQEDRAELALQSAESLVASVEASSETRDMRGCIAAARAYLANARGNTHLATEHARQALAHLSGNAALSGSLRGVVSSIIGDASWMNGDLTGAKKGYSDAAIIGETQGNGNLVVIANSNLAEVLLEQGHLRQASRILSEMLAATAGPGGGRSPLAQGIFAGLSKVQYEQDQLEAAAQSIDQCIELCQRWENREHQAIAYVMKARLEHARGKYDQSKEARLAAERLAGERQFSTRGSIWLASALARLWIEGGDLDRASRAIQESGASLDTALGKSGVPYLEEPLYVALLRLLLASGDHATALALSHPLLQNADTGNRLGRVIEILVLQALVYQGIKESGEALSKIDRACSLAQSEGYIRIFLDEGEPIARLLYQARSRRIGAGYATELLASLDSESAVTPSTPQLLVEPLSSRELEVLRLIEAGYSNQEIADSLVISLLTAKRHISNIYGKLGVKSRTQAVSLGRTLGLFE